MAVAGKRLREGNTVRGTNEKRPAERRLLKRSL
jgi:hypothetical protein